MFLNCFFTCCLSGHGDELLKSLVDHLVRKKQQESPPAGAEPSVSGDANKRPDAIAVAKKVLELGSYDDFESILNIAIPKGRPLITALSPVSQMRKAYLKLSLLIHPDKLGSSFPEAKTAFQSLVRAFESLSSPTVEPDTETKTKAGKHKQLKRSNEVTARMPVYA